MKTKKLLALVLVLCMVVPFAVACAPAAAPAAPAAPAAEPAAPAAEPAAPAAEPAAPAALGVDGFNVSVCLASEPMSIDPALNSAVDGAIMLQHMFEGLIKWVDDGAGNATLVPGMAEKWDISDDGLVWTFHLRDAKWSDGQPVTAQDFVYSWQRLANPVTAADYNYMLDMVLNATDIMAGNADPSTLGAKAIDDKTLEVTLNVACPYFEEICAFPATFPVRQDIIEQYGDQWTFDVNTYIGNGPYKMTEWVHNSYIMTGINENYYDAAKLGPQTIKYTLMDDQNAMLAAFRNGELNFIEDMPVDEIPALKASGELQIVKYIGTYYCCFNVTAEPFTDARVRKAFNLVIDRNYIVDQITRTGQVPASGFVPSGIYDAEGPSGNDFRTVGGDYFKTDAASYQANCDEARALLAEAGYPNGEGFPVVEYLYNTSDNHRAIGEALQQMWATELGVTVNLANQDWAVFLETRKNGDYQIARNGWIADYNDPCSFIDMWVTGSGNNDAQYSDAEYDAFVAESKSSSDPAVRMAALHKAEDLIIGRDGALAPIYFYTQKYMSQGFTGMYYTPLGYFFFGYTQPAA